MSWVALRCCVPTFSILNNNKQYSTGMGGISIAIHFKSNEMIGKSMRLSDGALIKPHLVYQADGCVACIN